MHTPVVVSGYGLRPNPTYAVNDAVGRISVA